MLDTSCTFVCGGEQKVLPGHVGDVNLRRRGEKGEADKQTLQERSVPHQACFVQQLKQPWEW